MKNSFTIAAVCAAMAAFATPASAATVAEASSNGTFATAQSLDGLFTLDSDANIFNSTTTPHATVLGGSNYESQFDYYKFSVATANSTGLFDIDGALANPNNPFGFDSFLSLFDSTGTLLLQHDDGGIVDPGSFHPWDSYAQFTFANVGEYTLRVGTCCESESNGQYTLNVSLQSPGTGAVPEPATWAMMLVGFGAIGATMRRRREDTLIAYA